MGNCTGQRARVLSLRDLAPGGHGAVRDSGPTGDGSRRLVFIMGTWLGSFSKHRELFNVEAGIVTNAVFG